LLWVQARHTVDRGYLREAGIVTEQNLAGFDDLVGRLFPREMGREGPLP
jgi:hypothetical protein